MRHHVRLQSSRTTLCVFCQTRRLRRAGGLTSLTGARDQCRPFRTTSGTLQSTERDLSSRFTNDSPEPDALDAAGLMERGRERPQRRSHSQANRTEDSRHQGFQITKHALRERWPNDAARPLTGEEIRERRADRRVKPTGDSTRIFLPRMPPPTPRRPSITQRFGVPKAQESYEAVEGPDNDFASIPMEEIPGKPSDISAVPPELQARMDAERRRQEEEDARKAEAKRKEEEEKRRREEERIRLEEERFQIRLAAAKEAEAVEERAKVRAQLRREEGARLLAERRAREAKERRELREAEERLSVERDQQMRSSEAQRIAAASGRIQSMLPDVTPRLQHTSPDPPQGSITASTSFDDDRDAAGRVGSKDSVDPLNESNGLMRQANSIMERVQASGSGLSDEEELFLRLFAKKMGMKPSGQQDSQPPALQRGGSRPFDVPQSTPSMGHEEQRLNAQTSRPPSNTESQHLYQQSPQMPTGESSSRPDEDYPRHAQETYKPDESDHHGIRRRMPRQIGSMDDTWTTTLGSSSTRMPDAGSQRSEAVSSDRERLIARLNDQTSERNNPRGPRSRSDRKEADDDLSRELFAPPKGVNVKPDSFDPALTRSWELFKDPSRRKLESTPQEETLSPRMRKFVARSGMHACVKCGEMGHIAALCPKPNRWKTPTNASTSSNMDAADFPDRGSMKTEKPSHAAMSRSADAAVSRGMDTKPLEKDDPFSDRLALAEKQEPEVRRPRTLRNEEIDDDKEDDEIILRSRKFSEPADSKPVRRSNRSRRGDDDDDVDYDEGRPTGRGRGARRSSFMREEEEDDDDSRPRRGGRRARSDEDDDTLEMSKGVQRMRERRKRDRDAKSKLKRQEAVRKASLADRRSKTMAKVTLPNFITVSRLAQALGVKIDHFTRRMERLGFENTAHDHVLNSENASLIALEYNYDAEVGSEISVSTRDLIPRPTPNDTSSLPERPPIVTIMGHVDHGKTTILDYLRKSSIAASEHGGITQHIGAFSVRMSGGKTVTFLDTPGHAAFLSMRKRGATVTDIVILVVAADDSVKPQTLEALKHAQEAKVPIIVAINKVDKPEADIQRVKQDLSRHGVEIEDFGGEVQVVPVSGKTGEGMNDLEEAVVTLGEISDYRAETEGPVEGWVLEATTKASGRVATVLVRRGTLKIGDVLVAGQTWAKVKSLQNEAGASVAEATPGTPVEVDGWREQPVAGDLALEADSEQRATDVVELRAEAAERTKMAEDVDAINEARRVEQEKRDREKAAEEAASKGLEAAETPQQDEGGDVESDKLEVPFIIKADVSGSVEAVDGYLQQLINPLCSPRILRSAVGPVSEFDVEHAAAAKGHVIAFNLASPSQDVAGLAAQKGVRVLEQNVIYRLLDQVKGVLQENLKPVLTQRVTGEAEVVKAFDIGIGGRKTLRIAGSRIRNGEIKRGSKVRVLRGGEKIYDGTISSLKNVKKDVTEMRKGTECGIGFDDWTDAIEGDQIQTYDEIVEERTLPV